MDPQLLWAKASAYCAKSEHCEQDVRQKLRVWNPVETADTEAIIQRLYKEDYLNTERYARAYAHDKLRYALWGPKKIAMMLRAKGVDSASIQAGLGALPEDELEEIRQKVEAAKRKQLGAMAETYEGKIKVLRFLAAHGF